jgi:hypothetical protein
MSPSRCSTLQFISSKRSRARPMRFESSVTSTEASLPEPVTIWNSACETSTRRVAPSLTVKRSLIMTSSVPASASDEETADVLITMRLPSSRTVMPSVSETVTTSTTASSFGWSFCLMLWKRFRPPRAVRTASRAAMTLVRMTRSIGWRLADGAGTGGSSEWLQTGPRVRQQVRPHDSWIPLPGVRFARSIFETSIFGRIRPQLPFCPDPDCEHLEDCQPDPR